MGGGVCVRELGRGRLLFEFSCPENVSLSCSTELLHRWHFWWYSESTNSIKLNSENSLLNLYLGEMHQH